MKTILLSFGILAAGLGVGAQVPSSPGQSLEKKAAPVMPEVMHASVVQTFVRSEGLGLSRMPTVHRSTIPEFAMGDKVYRVKMAQLIGMENHPQPTAYITPGLSPKKSDLQAAVRQKTIQTRPVTPFEKEALSQLAAGKQLAFGTHEGSPVMAGALVTTRECLNCHSGQEGRMLGAMSYTLEEVLSPKPAELKPTLGGRGEVIKVSSVNK
jgi:hypothetical protein